MFHNSAKTAPVKDNDDIKLLRRLIPLATLSATRFKELCEGVAIEKGGKGDLLFKQGDRKKEFVYLLSGKVSLQAGGEEMDRVEGGSETARFALAHQIPRKVSAIARTRVRYVRVDPDFVNTSETQENKKKDVYLVGGISEESSDDWMTTMLQSRVFQKLPAKNLQQVMMGLEEVKLKKGEPVVRQGDKGDYYYIIKEGHCSVTRRPTAGAKEVKLGELAESESFGEDALISEGERSVTVSMMRDGSLLRLKKDKFLKLVKEPIIRFLDYRESSDAVGNGACWLDVRVADFHKKRCLSGSHNLPFFSFRAKVGSLDKNQKLIIVCDDSKVSEAAAFFLIRFGFDAVVLKGGLDAVPEEALSYGEEAKIPKKDELSEKEPRTEDPGIREQLGEEKAARTKIEALKETALEQQVDSTQKLQKLQSKVEKQQAENSQKETELNSLRAAFGDREKELDKLRGRCEEFENSSEKSIQETEALNIKVKQLQQVEQEARGTAGEKERRLEAEQKELEKQLSNKDSEFSTQAEKITELERAEAVLRASLSESEDKLIKLSNSNDLDRKNAGEQGDRLQDEKDRLEADLVVRDQSLSAVKTEKEEADRSIQQLEAEQKELEKQLSVKDLELSTQAEKIAELEQAEAALQAGLGDYEDKITKLNDRLDLDSKSGDEQVDKLQHDKNRLESELADRDHVLSAIKTEKEEADHSILKLKELLAEKEALVDSQSTELTTLVEKEEQVTALEKELIEKQSDFDMMQQSLSKAQEESEAMAAAKHQYDEDFENVEKELKEAIEALTKEKESKQALVSSIENSEVNSDRELAELRNKLDEAGKDAEQSSQKLQEVEVGHNELTQEARELRTQIEALQLEKQAAEQQINTVKEELVSEQSERQEYESELEKAKQEQGRLAEELGSINLKFGELQAEGEELIRQSEVAGGKQAEFQKEIDELSAKFTGLTETHEELVSENRELKEELDSLALAREENEKLIRQAKEENEQGEQKRNDLISRVDQLENELENEREKHKEGITQIADLTDKNGVLEEKFEKSTVELVDQQSIADKQAEAHLEILREKDSTLNNKAAELEALATRHDKEFTELRNQVEELEVKRLAAEKLAEKREEELEYNESVYNDKLTEIDEQESQFKDEIAALRAESSEWSSRLEEKTAALKEQEEKSFSLRKENAVFERRMQEIKEGDGDMWPDDDELVVLREEKIRIEGEIEQVISEKSLLAEQVGSLAEQNDELKSLIQDFMKAAEESQGGDLESLQAELAMVREQAEADVNAINEQLLEAQEEAGRLSKELEENVKHQEGQELVSPLNSDLSASDHDIFSIIEEKQSAAATTGGHVNHAAVSKTGGFKKIIAILFIGMAAGAGLFYTDQGRALLGLDAPVSAQKQMASGSPVEVKDELKNENRRTSNDPRRGEDFGSLLESVSGVTSGNNGVDELEMSSSPIEEETGTTESTEQVSGRTEEIESETPGEESVVVQEEDEILIDEGSDLF